MLKSPSIPAENATAPLLVLGDLQGWQRAGRVLPQHDGLRFADPGDITACLLHIVAPKVVLSPLICTAYDVIDIALRLVDAGFSGAYRCIAEGGYDLSLIAQEVAQAAPALNFAIIQMDGDGIVITATGR